MGLFDSIAEVFVGKSPKAPNTSGLEATNAEILRKMSSQIPLSFEEEQWLSDYNPALLSAAPSLKSSQIGGIQTDPKLLEAQLAALSDLEGIADTGMSDADLYAQRQEEKDLNRQAKGRVDTVRQNFASRGLGGSGLDLLAQLQTMSDADEAAADSSAQRAASASQNRMAATQAAGSMAGQLSSQEYQRKMNAAQAADEIERFNTTNSIGRQQYNNQMINDSARANAAGRQAVASSNVANKNNFAQTTFQNQKDMAGLEYNANAGKANQQLDRYAMDKQAHNQAKGQVIQSAATLGGAAMMMSDERVKKNVHQLSDNDIEDFLNSIEPVNFKYNNSNKPRVGVLAQDIEKGSRVGSEMVQEDENGVKGLDQTDLLGALLSAVSYLHRSRKE